jgi:hypothetical protein
MIAFALSAALWLSSPAGEPAAGRLAVDDFAQFMGYVRPGDEYRIPFGLLHYEVVTKWDGMKLNRIDWVVYPPGGR